MNGFRGRHVHTVDYRDAEDFRGQDVVVVGGGTSAIGFLMELEGVAGSLTWATRRPIEFLEEQELNIEGGTRAVTLQDAAAREDAPSRRSSRRRACRVRAASSRRSSAVC